MHLLAVYAHPLRQSHLFYDVDQSPENRRRYLAEAGEIGRRFGSAARVPRRPDLGSDRVA